MKQVINFLIGHCFLNFGNLSIRQFSRIPMDSEPAPFMANIFLYYENKWPLDAKKDLFKVHPNQLLKKSHHTSKIHLTFLGRLTKLTLFQTTHTLFL